MGGRLAIEKNRPGKYATENHSDEQQNKGSRSQPSGRHGKRYPGNEGQRD